MEWKLEVWGRQFKLVRPTGPVVVIGSQVQARKWAKLAREAGQEAIAGKLDAFAYGVQAKFC